ncbi:FeoB-associated Cys-rich membrane protein [Primorskyibacter sp. S187A]
MEAFLDLIFWVVVMAVLFFVIRRAQKKKRDGQRGKDE